MFIKKEFIPYFEKKAKPSLGLSPLRRIDRTSNITELKMLTFWNELICFIINTDKYT